MVSAPKQTKAHKILCIQTFENHLSITEGKQTPQLLQNAFGTGYF